EPITGHAGCKSERMLLGDTDIEKALRVFFGKIIEPRAIGHRWRNADQPFILVRHVNQPFTEYLRVRLAAESGDGMSIAGVELAHAVIFARVVFRRLVTAAFLCRHVQKLRPGQLPDIAQGGDEDIKVVTIDRSDVVEA